MPEEKGRPASSRLSPGEDRPRLSEAQPGAPDGTCCFGLDTASGGKPQPSLDRKVIVDGISTSRSGLGLPQLLSGTGRYGRIRRAALLRDGGPGTAARLQRPRGVAWDGGSTIYIADSNNQRIRALDLETGIIITLAGSSAGYGGDGGPAADARLRNPRGLTVDAEGRLIIADTFNSRIRVITPAVP